MTSTLPADGANSTELPDNLRFTDESVVIVTVYAALFVVAAAGNLTVFVPLFRNRHRKSRINLMIMHLAVADLIVTFFTILLEIGWRVTVQWIAGEVACKVFLFLRAFGLYLSSMVLVCVSLDRYFAILHPLKVNDAQRRGKIMLAFAWIISAICSAPQSVVFRVQKHPQYENFTQCVTFLFFTESRPEQRMAYNIFCMLGMYVVPLVIIIFAYSRIIWKISKKSKETRDGLQSEIGQTGGRPHLRRSDVTNIEKARSRTLRMTTIIVIAFILCWTPYVVITMWFMFDERSARSVDSRLHGAFFVFAVSNSCVNPLVYGTYAINKRDCRSCWSLRAPDYLRRSSPGSGSSTATRVTRSEVTLANSFRAANGSASPLTLGVRVTTTTEGTLLSQVVTTTNGYHCSVQPGENNFLQDGSCPTTPKIQYCEMR